MGSVGYYVQRNSDNLAMYALAKYVMTQNGNVYPHLPIVIYRPDGPPYPPIPGALATFVTEGGDFYWNTTGGLTAWDTDPDTTPRQEYRGCPEAENRSGLNSPLTINAFAPDSAYPDSYNAQVSTWMKALGVGSNPDSGANAGQQIAIASYTNPLGDPTAWQRLISYDSSKLSILVANVLNGPDYEVDLSWSSVIQQAASSGKTVIGYVRTGYLGVSLQQFKTRLGSGDLADWASQIEQDVDKWFELYVYFLTCYILKIWNFDFENFMSFVLGTKISILLIQC